MGPQIKKAVAGSVSTVTIFPGGMQPSICFFPTPDPASLLSLGERTRSTSLLLVAFTGPSRDVPRFRAHEVFWDSAGGGVEVDGVEVRAHAHHQIDVALLLASHERFWLISTADTSRVFAVFPTPECDRT